MASPESSGPHRVLAGCGLRRGANVELLTPGYRVHRHEIVRALGSGGMGVVYDARDLR